MPSSSIRPMSGTSQNSTGSRPRVSPAAAANRSATFNWAPMRLLRSSSPTQVFSWMSTTVGTGRATPLRSDSTTRTRLAPAASGSAAGDDGSPGSPGWSRDLRTAAPGSGSPERYGGGGSRSTGTLTTPPASIVRRWPSGPGPATGSGSTGASGGTTGKPPVGGG